MISSIPLTKATQYIQICRAMHSPKTWKIALWPSTNESIVMNLVLASSKSIWTEMTDYTCISLQQAGPELQYNKCLIYCTTSSYYCNCLTFVKHTFVCDYTSVRPQCDFSIPGRTHRDKESFLMWMSHVSYTTIQLIHEICSTMYLHLENESRLMWMSHISCEWVMSPVPLRTKSCLESSGCRTCPLKTSRYQPRLTPMGTNKKCTLVRS